METRKSISTFSSSKSLLLLPIPDFLPSNISVLLQLLYFLQESFMFAYSKICICKMSLSYFYASLKGDNFPHVDRSWKVFLK